jgi:uncharacterized membrane protein
MKFLFDVKDRYFSWKIAASVTGLQFAISIVNFPIYKIELKIIIPASFQKKKYYD